MCNDLCIITMPYHNSIFKYNLLWNVFFDLFFIPQNIQKQQERVCSKQVQALYFFSGLKKDEWRKSFLGPNQMATAVASLVLPHSKVELYQLTLRVHTLKYIFIINCLLQLDIYNKYLFMFVSIYYIFCISMFACYDKKHQQVGLACLFHKAH